MTYTDDEALLKYSDDELEDAQSVGSDDLEQDAEVEAFEYEQIAYMYARNAVKSGLAEAARKERMEALEELAELKAKHTVHIDNSPRSTAATETAHAASSIGTEDNDKESREPQMPVQRTPTWNLRPSVGTWLGRTKKLPLVDHFSRESKAEQSVQELRTEVSVPVATPPVRNARRDTLRPKRRIIGAVVRAPVDPKIADEAEPASAFVQPPACSSPASPTSQPYSPSQHFAVLRVGSAAGSLRHAKRSAAKKGPPTPQRLDLDDTPDAIAPLTNHKRPSSLTTAYKGLGAEFHRMDEGDMEADMQLVDGLWTGPLPGSMWFAQVDKPNCWTASSGVPAPAKQVTKTSAMALDLGEDAPTKSCWAPASPPPRNEARSSPTPRSGTAGQGIVAGASAATWTNSAKGGDLEEVYSSKVVWPPTPPPSQGRNASRARSMGFRVSKASEAAGLLPMLTATATPAMPIEWSSGAVRPTRRWATNASPMF